MRSLSGRVPDRSARKYQSGGRRRWHPGSRAGRRCARRVRPFSPALGPADTVSEHRLGQLPAPAPVPDAPSHLPVIHAETSPSPAPHSVFIVTHEQHDRGRTPCASCHIAVALACPSWTTTTSPASPSEWYPWHGMRNDRCARRRVTATRTERDFGAGSALLAQI